MRLVNTDTKLRIYPNGKEALHMQHLPLLIHSFFYFHLRIAWVAYLVEYFHKLVTGDEFMEIFNKVKENNEEPEDDSE